MRLDPQNEPDLFEMTCGGYGLTGVILAATLQLEPMPGWTASVDRVPIDGLAEGLALVRERTPRSAFAYTWHDGTPVEGAFGRGFVYVGQLPEGPPPTSDVVPRYRRLTSASRPRLRVPSLGTHDESPARHGVSRLRGVAAPLVGHAPVRRALPLRAAGRVLPALWSTGPRRGPVARAATAGSTTSCAPSRGRSSLLRPPAVMASMKLFRGEGRFLRFEGDGVCVTIDLVRSAEGLGFLSVLDRLTLEFGGLPHIIKDSRLPADVVERSYPGYEEFRERRRALDPGAAFRSELSARLGL